MNQELCGAVYRRPHDLLDDGATIIFQCQYLNDHPDSRHSWFTLKHYDDLLVERWKQEQQKQDCDETPKELIAFLDAIADGRADAYLEAILAAGHARKRALRGVRLPYGVKP